MTIKDKSGTHTRANNYSSLIFYLIIFKINGCLSSAELLAALTCLVKFVQSKTFPDELDCLKKKKLSNSCLCLLDSKSIIRVRGCLKNANLSVDRVANTSTFQNSHFFLTFPENFP